MKGSEQLQKGQINILDRSQCDVSFLNHFCAGPSNIGGCPGDDGTAVICDEVLYGLVGWRHEDYCSEPYKSHLYVDIANYHQWIHDLTSSSRIIISSSFLVFLSALTQVFN